MNLFARFASFFAPAQRTVAHPFLTGDDPPAAATLTSAFQQSTWVYACVTTLAENVSAIPFRVMGDGSGADAAAKLFAQPHRRMDRFAFWELIIGWLCLRGEAFILPTLSSSSSSSFSSSKAVVESLLLLNPDQMRELIIGHDLAGWNFTGSGPNSP